MRARAGRGYDGGGGTLDPGGPMSRRAASSPLLPCRGRMHALAVMGLVLMVKSGGCVRAGELRRAHLQADASCCEQMP